MFYKPSRLLIIDEVFNVSKIYYLVIGIHFGLELLKLLLLGLVLLDLLIVIRNGLLQLFDFNLHVLDLAQALLGLDGVFKDWHGVSCVGQPLVDVKKGLFSGLGPLGQAVNFVLEAKGSCKEFNVASGCIDTT